MHFILLIDVPEMRGWISEDHLNDRILTQTSNLAGSNIHAWRCQVHYCKRVM